jgi:hypothetical protein
VNLDRLVDHVKTNPKSQVASDAIRQIVFVYESQGKTVEAAAWRDKLLGDDPKANAPDMPNNSPIVPDKSAKIV